ncbi:MAG: DUF2961 domain-containing protein [Spirochaetes bacterium]|nr:DUF2961 domain-containing protein [Spirochaetota bacterium]
MRLQLLLLVSFAMLAAQDTTANPLAGIERTKNFESMRASSSAADWKNGNGDARGIAPGGSLVIAELEGPGMITHIWNTVMHEDKYYPRLLTIRIYWDGETNPSVESPLGDFFGIGHGVDQAFTSLPLRVSADGRARNCYWPMPFRKSARIVISNESDKRCNAFYYYVDWQKHTSIPDDALYFHAMYRQEFPCVMGRNYLLADIEGRGHYVGTIQSVFHVSDGWYGEGDDFFFIDGASEPQLRGTGTEDYFCDAWGFREQSGPFYGTPLWEGGRTGSRGTAYRFHIPDPVVFTKSLRAEIEHKGAQTFPDGTKTYFIERDDLMSSVALWYQTEPHKQWTALPLGPDRLPFRENVVYAAWKAAETAQHSEAQVQAQPIAAATGGKQLFFLARDEKAWIEFPFTVLKEVSGEFFIRLTHSYDYGLWRIKLDGQDLGIADGFDPKLLPPVLHKFGNRTLTAGKHTVRFECTGRSPASKGYYLGVDCVGFYIPVYSRAADVDLRTLQKK